MSEKLFALLFRLYPARFRARWCREALDLIRDRMRDERGFVPRLRLWYDLAADFATSLPGAYMRDTPELSPAGPTQAVPSFMMIKDEPIRPSAFFFGTVFTLVALAGIFLLSRHGGHFPIMRASQAEDAGGITVDPWATGSGSGGDGSVMALGNGANAATSAAAGRPATRVVHVGGPAPTPFFDAAEKHRVLIGIGKVLEQRYPSPQAKALGKHLLASEAALARTGDPGAFAAGITQQLRAESHDKHFEVAFSSGSMAAGLPVVTNAAMYRRAMQEANCMIQPPTILPHNIGYLKLDWFAEPEICGDAMISALKALGRADAVILDLRDNSGGSPAMVMFMGGWLFDRPAFFYNPRESDAAAMWTHSPMAGSRLADKPVYILTSSQTYSAAEHFSYDLKELHRATLVGETTAGATDVGVFHRIDEHFGIGLRESRVANPYPEPDWAVAGVRPDVAVPASGALAAAEQLAAARLGRR